MSSPTGDFGGGAKLDSERRHCHDLDLVDSSVADIGIWEVCSMAYGNEPGHGRECGLMAARGYASFESHVSESFAFYRSSPRTGQLAISTDTGAQVSSLSPAFGIDPMVAGYGDACRTDEPVCKLSGMPHQRARFETQSTDIQSYEPAENIDATCSHSCGEDEALVHDAPFGGYFGSTQGKFECLAAAACSAPSLALHPQVRCSTTGDQKDLQEAGSSSHDTSHCKLPQPACNTDIVSATKCKTSSGDSSSVSTELSFELEGGLNAPSAVLADCSFESSSAGKVQGDIPHEGPHVHHRSETSFGVPCPQQQHVLSEPLHSITSESEASRVDEERLQWGDPQQRAKPVDRSDLRNLCRTSVANQESSLACDKSPSAVLGGAEACDMDHSGAPDCDRGSEPAATRSSVSSQKRVSCPQAAKRSHLEAYGSVGSAGVSNSIPPALGTQTVLAGRGDVPRCDNRSCSPDGVQPTREETQCIKTHDCELGERIDDRRSSISGDAESASQHAPLHGRPESCDNRVPHTRDCDLESAIRTNVAGGIAQAATRALCEGRERAQRLIAGSQPFQTFLSLCSEPTGSVHYCKDLKDLGGGYHDASWYEFAQTGCNGSRARSSADSSVSTTLAVECGARGFELPTMQADCGLEGTVSGQEQGDILRERPPSDQKLGPTFGVPCPQQRHGLSEPFHSTLSKIEESRVDEERLPWGDPQQSAKPVDRSDLKKLCTTSVANQECVLACDKSPSAVMGDSEACAMDHSGEPESDHGGEPAATSSASLQSHVSCPQAATRPPLGAHGSVRSAEPWPRTSNSISPALGTQTVLAGRGDVPRCDNRSCSPDGVQPTREETQCMKTLDCEPGERIDGRRSSISGDAESASQHAPLHGSPESRFPQVPCPGGREFESGVRTNADAGGDVLVATPATTALCEGNERTQCMAAVSQPVHICWEVCPEPTGALDYCKELQKLGRGDDDALFDEFPQPECDSNRARSSGDSSGSTEPASEFGERGFESPTMQADSGLEGTVSGQEQGDILRERPPSDQKLGPTFGVPCPQQQHGLSEPFHSTLSKIEESRVDEERLPWGDPRQSAKPVDRSDLRNLSRASVVDLVSPPTCEEGLSVVMGSRGTCSMAHSGDPGHALGSSEDNDASQHESPQQACNAKIVIVTERDYSSADASFVAAGLTSECDPRGLEPRSTMHADCGSGNVLSWKQQIDIPREVSPQHRSESHADAPNSERQRELNSKSGTTIEAKAAGGGSDRLQWLSPESCAERAATSIVRDMRTASVADYESTPPCKELLAHSVVLEDEFSLVACVPQTGSMYPESAVVNLEVHDVKHSAVARVRIRASKPLQRLMDAAFKALRPPESTASLSSVAGWYCFSSSGRRLLGSDTVHSQRLQDGAIVQFLACSMCVACVSGLAEAHGTLVVHPSPELSLESRGWPAKGSREVGQRDARRTRRAGKRTTAAEGTPERAWELYRDVKLSALRARLEQQWQQLVADAQALELLEWRLERCSSGSLPAAASTRLRHELDVMISELSSKRSDTAETQETQERCAKRARFEDQACDAVSSAGSPILEQLFLDRARMPSPLNTYLDICHKHGPLSDSETREALQRWSTLDEQCRAALWSMTIYQAHLQDLEISTLLRDKGWDAPRLPTPSNQFTRFLYGYRNDTPASPLHTRGCDPRDVFAAQQAFLASIEQQGG